MAPARRIQLQEAFKLALSVTLFYWLALSLNWPSPKNGAIAIAVTSLATVGESLNKGLLRILGTARRRSASSPAPIPSSSASGCSRRPTRRSTATSDS